MNILLIGIVFIILGIFFAPFALQSLKIDQEELGDFGGWRRATHIIVYIMNAFTLSNLTGWLVIATLGFIGGGAACIIYSFM
ncbi:MAG: hypothetical protein ACI33M_14820 [Lysinibacillus sp.]